MKKYDYIIIGAGSAGCVLANRLSANPSNSVLLLEAGGKDNDIYLSIPGAYGKLFRRKIDWGFYTEPQEHVNNRRMYLPRGKTLGGSSSINAMAYVRGNKEDYNDWAKLGNEGWSYDEILHYFTKSEYNEQCDELDLGYHGKTGELNVTFPQQFRSPYGDAFIQAARQAGVPKNKDFNGTRQEGVSNFQFNIKNGARHSGATAFLKPALKRPNFTAVTKAYVNRILIENDKATGVEFIKGKNGTEQVFANKEVIVCAGAFNSPQVLMLSGIGDESELKHQNIECKKHIPGVGKNLQDHLFYSISASSLRQDGVNHYIPVWKQFGALMKYLFQRKGPFTISPLEAVIFENLDHPGARANFQFHFACMTAGKGYDYDMYDMNTYPSYDGFTILPTLTNPKSVGYVGLRSSNPVDTPLIQPNFLSEEADLIQLVKGARRALEIIQQPAFDNFRKEIVAPPNGTSDEEIIEHLKKSIETVYHPVGTCKMGNDEMAVVDDELRVHGIEGLRVVDASIMPKIVTGNTNAPVYMIAEKAADMILDNKKSRKVAESLAIYND